MKPLVSPTKLPRVFAIPLVAGLLLGWPPIPLQGQLIFEDDFSGTSTNPNDFGYFLSADFSTGTITESNGERSLRLTGNDSAADGDNLFKQFVPVTLQDGQSIRLTFTITGANSGGIDNQASFWLGNTTNVFTENQAKAAWGPYESIFLRIRTASQGTSSIASRNETDASGNTLLFGGNNISNSESPFVPNQTSQNTSFIYEIRLFREVHV